jgi:hypothetical protein
MMNKKRDITAPGYSTGEIGTIDSTTVVVVFSEEVKATNFVTGVTIKNGVTSQTISSGTLQADNKTVRYVIALPASVTDTLTWEYTGGVITDLAGNSLATVSAQTLTNNVVTFRDMFARADGAIGNGWTGADFVISTNKTKNGLASLGPELFANPGAEGTYTSGVAANWTAVVNTGTPAEDSTTKHGGSKAQHLTSAAGQNEYVGPSYATVTSGLYYLMSIWVKIITSTFNFIHRPSSGTSNLWDRPGENYSNTGADTSN